MPNARRVAALREQAQVLRELADTFDVPSVRDQLLALASSAARNRPRRSRRIHLPKREVPRRRKPVAIILFGERLQVLGDAQYSQLNRSILYRGCYFPAFPRNGQELFSLSLRHVWFLP
jgi:hypothetical protein